METPSTSIETFHWKPRKFTFDIQSKANIKLDEYILVPITEMRSIIRHIVANWCDLSDNSSEESIFRYFNSSSEGKNPTVTIQHTNNEGISSARLDLIKNIPKLEEYKNYMDFSRLSKTSLYLTIPPNRYNNNLQKLYYIYWEELVFNNLLY